MRWCSRPSHRLPAAVAVAVAALTVPVRAGTVAPPNDPLFGRQWNLPLIQVPDAWSVSRGGGATVAVLDTGVAYEDYGDGRFSYRKLPGFSRTRFAPGYDFVDRDDHPNDGLGEDLARPAHGTHAAAVVAETTNEGRGTASVAPRATIMPVRVLDWDGNGEVAAIAEGIRFAADHGAQVLVMSLAGTDTGPVADAVAYAAGKGVIMIAPTGNQGAAGIRFPASHPDVIAVGAVAPNKARAYYSNYGEGLDLVAPGGDLRRDLTGDGEPDGIRQGTFVNTLDGFCFCQKEGTSSAAPHVAGVVALLVGSGLATTPAQVRHALESSALDLGPPGRDPEFGAGLVQASAALDAAAAVAADLSVTVESPGGPSPSTPVTATIRVANRGPAPATGVALTDNLATGATATTATASQGTCSAGGGTVSCELGDLAVGASATVTVVATATGELRHEASVRGDQGDGNLADNSSPPRPDPDPDEAAPAAPNGPSGDDGGGSGRGGFLAVGAGAVLVAVGVTVALVRHRRQAQAVPSQAVKRGAPPRRSPRSR